MCVCVVVEPLCYRVCVREEANKSANAVACHNRTLLQSIVSFVSVALVIMDKHRQTDKWMDGRTIEREMTN